MMNSINFYSSRINFNSIASLGATEKNDSLIAKFAKIAQRMLHPSLPSIKRMKKKISLAQHMFSAPPVAADSNPQEAEELVQTEPCVVSEDKDIFNLPSKPMPRPIPRPRPPTAPPKENSFLEGGCVKTKESELENLWLLLKESSVDIAKARREGNLEKALLLLDEVDAALPKEPLTPEAARIVFLAKIVLLFEKTVFHEELGNVSAILQDRKEIETLIKNNRSLVESNVATLSPFANFSSDISVPTSLKIQLADDAKHLLIKYHGRFCNQYLSFPIDSGDDLDCLTLFSSQEISDRREPAILPGGCVQDSNLVSALPPAAQEAREKKAILNDPRLFKLLGETPIREIKKVEGGYVVITDFHEMKVDIKYIVPFPDKPICGPALFEFVFHEPTLQAYDAMIFGKQTAPNESEIDVLEKSQEDLEKKAILNDAGFRRMIEKNRYIIKDLIPLRDQTVPRDRCEESYLSSPNNPPVKVFTYDIPVYNSPLDYFNTVVKVHIQRFPDNELLEDRFKIFEIRICHL